MNEQDIPIDIHVNKLSDWLVSRRIVDKNWQRNIKDVRNMINEALKDMPGNSELIELLSGSYINYFHCQQIVEILKTTERDSKNIFGSYTSQRMKDWAAIIRAYERESLYLAEAAQLLARNINYEIPSARKQMTTLEKLAADALNRAGDAVKTETILRGEFGAACAQLGIAGEKIKLELTEKIKDLPAMQTEIAACLPQLQPAISLYGNFSGNKHCVPVLKHLIKSGNTTVYEYKYGEAPVKIEQPKLPFETDSAEEGEIDFGDDGVEIDFGGDGEIDFGGDGEIDFGDEGAGEINWDVEEVMEEVPEIDLEISLENSGIVVEEDGMSGGVARGDEAFTLLDSLTYRDVLVDELFELDAFLRMRQYELQASDKVHVISMSLLDGFTDHDAKSVGERLRAIGDVLAALTAPHYMQIFRIKHSPKYVDILANKLQQKLRGIERVKTSQSVLREKSKELKESAAALVPGLNKMIEQTKILQKNIEKDISKRYKNRVVNLMGSNI